MLQFETALATLSAKAKEDTAKLDVFCCMLHATDAKVRPSKQERTLQPAHALQFQLALTSDCAARSLCASSRLSPLSSLLSSQTSHLSLRCANIATRPPL